MLVDYPKFDYPKVDYPKFVVYFVDSFLIRLNQNR